MAHPLDQFVRRTKRRNLAAHREISLQFRRSFGQQKATCPGNLKGSRLDLATVRPPSAGILPRPGEVQRYAGCAIDFGDRSGINNTVLRAMAETPDQDSACAQRP